MRACAVLWYEINRKLHFISVRLTRLTLGRTSTKIFIPKKNTILMVHINKVQEFERAHLNKWVISFLFHCLKIIGYESNWNHFTSFKCEIKHFFCCMNNSPIYPCVQFFGKWVDFLFMECALSKPFKKRIEFNSHFIQ